MKNTVHMTNDNQERKDRQTERQKEGGIHIVHLGLAEGQALT